MNTHNISLRDKQIGQQYLNGLSLHDVGLRFNITRERVRQILVKTCITERWTKERKKKSDIYPTVVRTMAFYLQGQTMSAAARSAGMTIVQMRKYCPTPTSLQVRLHNIARFWQRVVKRDFPHPVLKTPCWIWQGYINSITGYGQTRFNNRQDSAHRVAYTLAKGTPKQWVLHHCDVSSCVNPEHLYDGIPANNAQDREQRGRTHRLNQNMVDAIRQQLSNKSTLADCVVLAKQFGVSPTTILNIKNKRTWASNQRGFPKEKVLAVMRYGRTKTGKEIARILGIAESTAHSIRNGYSHTDITGLPPKSKQKKLRNI